MLYQTFFRSSFGKFVLSCVLVLLVGFNSLNFTVVRASGVVGNGNVGSCNEAAFDTALSNGGIITFNCGTAPVVINLRNQKTIVSNVTIDGNNSVTLSGSLITRLFVVNKNARLELNNLSIRDGLLFMDNAEGGAIYNQGTLVLNYTTLTENTAKSPQGDAHGGAIFNAGFLGVNSTTFNANKVVVQAETNPSSGYGAAIYNAQGAILDIINSTFSANSTDSFLIKGNAGSGGAIFNAGALNITNSTIAYNKASPANGSGGIDNFYARTNGKVTLKNTLLAFNTGFNCTGDITDGGGNLQYSPPFQDSQGKLIFDSNCGSTIPFDQNPLIQDLNSNGGLTQTHALLPGSPAIDTGNQAICPAFDQRGYRRPVDGNNDGKSICDIGAFEFGSNSSNPNNDKVSVNTSYANLVSRLRVTPDRKVKIDPDNVVKFQLEVHNEGMGAARNSSIQFPLNNNLIVGYTDFSDPRIWVSKIISGQYLQITLPEIAPGSIFKIGLYFRPDLQAKNNELVKLRYKIFWNDDNATGKQASSNAVQFTLSDTVNLNVSDGSIQSEEAPPVVLKKGDSFTYHADYYIPDELVTFWYTDTKGNSIELGKGQADLSGIVNFEVTTASLASGETYVIAGYGLDSGITGSRLITILAS